MSRSTQALKTFHESFGIVTTRQLSVYKAYNVSPSDHDRLVQVYGDRHNAIIAAVKDPRNQLGTGKCFSVFKFEENLEDDY